MSRLAPFVGVALAVILIAPPKAPAQTVELTAFGGLAFGGELIATPGYESVPLQAGPLYGGAFNVEFLPRWRLEALFMRQKTKVPGPAYGTYIDVNVDRYMGAILSHDPLSARWDVFGEFMLGATRYVPRGFESELWFTLGAAVGVKTYVTRNIGFRFEARGYYTPVVISGATVCGGSGCVIGYTGTGTFQGDISAGVIIGF
jgi:hypothetical protein